MKRYNDDDGKNCAIQKVWFKGSHFEVWDKNMVNRCGEKILQIVPVAPNEYIVEVKDAD